MPWLPALAQNLPLVANAPFSLYAAIKQTRKTLIGLGA
jgi:hypothetical protein